MIGRFTGTRVGQAPTPFTKDDIQAHCGAAGALYDAHVTGLLGQSRASDALLAGLARVADDLTFLQWTLDDPNLSHLAVAWDHVAAAIKNVLPPARDAETGPLWPYRDVSLNGSQDWARTVYGDGVELGGLHSLLDHLAFNQALSPRHVRARILTVLFDVAGHGMHTRAALLEPDKLDAAELAARRAYLDAATSAYDDLNEVKRAYVQGEVVTSALREALIARADAAHARWKAAWDLESTRVPYEATPPER